VATFVLTWNPDKWRWSDTDFKRHISNTARGRRVRGRWSVGSRTGGIEPGDTAFLLRQGRDRGLIAAGHFTSRVFEDAHWDGSKRLANYGDVEWNLVLAPEHRLRTEVLQQRVPAVHWGPYGSGMRLRPPADARVARAWHEHVSLAASDPTRAQAQPSASRSLGQVYRSAAEDVTISERNPWSVDPDKVDRGLRGHATTQNALAFHVRSLGCEPRSPRLTEPQFDVAWVRDGTVFVAEVKSLLPVNEEQQLRLGIGQLLRYRYILAATNLALRPYLVVERAPTDSSWLALCGSLGVTLTWPAMFRRTTWT
jgi:hypothetical protein